MSSYYTQLFFPDKGENCGVPDEFPRRTATTRFTWQNTITSSAHNGDVICMITPQLFCYPGTPAPAASGITTYADYSTDYVSVLALPSSWTTYTATYTNPGSAIMSGNVQSYRIVSFEAKFTYIGAPLYASGQSVIAFSNTNYVFPVNPLTANAWSLVHDETFKAFGPATDQFVAHWLPQNREDLDLQVQSSTPLDASNFMGNIYFLSTGLPVSTHVYRCDICTLIEYVPNPQIVDLIPLTMNSGNYYDEMYRIKQAVIENPRLVCANVRMNDDWNQEAKPSKKTRIERVDFNVQGFNLDHLR